MRHTKISFNSETCNFGIAKIDVRSYVGGFQTNEIGFRTSKTNIEMTNTISEQTKTKNKKRLSSNPPGAKTNH